MTKGYICIVQNNKTVDYLRLAYALGLSIKNTQSTVDKLSIVTDIDIDNIPVHYQKVFDHIIPIKNDRAKNVDWKLDNIIDLYDYTPYEETVMLDSDMLFLSDVSHWWEVLQYREIWFTSNIRTYKNEASPQDSIYRQEFIKNKLPSVHNAFFYFKKGDKAEQLFNMMKLVYKNWDFCCNQYLTSLKPKIFSTDVAFGLAVKILGFSEEAIFPKISFPYFTHMKTQNQNWDLNGCYLYEDWMNFTDVSFDTFNNSLGIKIGTIRQFGPLHYHVKDFLTNEMIEVLEDPS